MHQQGLQPKVQTACILTDFDLVITRNKWLVYDHNLAWVVEDRLSISFHDILWSGLQFLGSAHCLCSCPAALARHSWAEIPGKLNRFHLFQLLVPQRTLRFLSVFHFCYFKCLWRCAGGLGCTWWQYGPTHPLSTSSGPRDRPETLRWQKERMSQDCKSCHTISSQFLKQLKDIKISSQKLVWRVQKASQGCNPFFIVFRENGRGNCLKRIRRWPFLAQLYAATVRAVTWRRLESLEPRNFETESPTSLGVGIWDGSSPRLLLFQLFSCPKLISPNFYI